MKEWFNNPYYGIFNEFSLIVLPIFGILAIIYGILRFRLIVKKSEKLGQAYLISIFLCLLGGIGAPTIYMLKYGGGDFFVYFYTAETLVQIFYNDPTEWIKYLFMNLNTANEIYYSSDIFFQSGRLMSLDVGDQNFFTSKIISVLAIPTFGDLFSTTILLVIVKAEASLYFYNAFSRIFPENSLALLIAVFFVPSTIFWSSAVGKDSISYVAVLYGFGNILLLFEKKKTNYTVIFLILLCYLISKVRLFILLSIIIGIAVLLTSGINSKIKNIYAKILFVFIVVPLCFLAFFMLVATLTAGNQQFNVDTLSEQVYLRQKDLTNPYYFRNREGMGSTYQLGDFEPTVPGLLSKAPIAIYTALFRPHLWDSTSPLVLISALEASIFLIIAGYILVTIGPVRIITHTFKDPMLLLFISYTIFFGFFLGMTSGNFGNLTRYRVTILPFWVAYLLSFVFMHLREQKARKELRRKAFLKRYEKLNRLSPPVQQEG